MGKKIWNMLLFLAVAAVCTVLTLYMGRDASSMMLYNFVFLGVMAVIYLIGIIGGMWKMNNLGTSLKLASAKLEEYFQTQGAKSEKLSTRLDSLFDHSYLDKKMKNFLVGMRRSKEGIVDLEEYLNEEELDSYVHKRMLEMIPDILTSLGILGTFVGLVWGLRNFEPSSYESMTSSVSMLVEGIKVAFLTSIYGVSLSIVYTYGIKSEYTYMTEELQEFLAKFHGYVMPTAENKSRNLLVAIQKQQTEALTQMAEEFSTHMVSGFQEMIAPTFERMNHTLESLSEAVTTRQQEALKEIVDAFLVEMHNAFKVQFQDFQSSMEQLTKAQQDNVAYTQKLYQNLADEMKASSAESSKNMDKILKNMGETQNQYLQTAGEILEENRKIQTQQQRDYEHLTDYLRDAEKSSAKFWVACNQAMQKYVEAAAGGTSELGKIAEQSGQIIQSNRKLMEGFDVKMKEYADYQKLNYQLMLQMCRLLSSMTVVKDEKSLYMVGGEAAAAAAQGTNKEVLDGIRDLVEAQSRTQKEFLDEMNKTLQALQKTGSRGRFGIFK